MGGNCNFMIAAARLGMRVGSVGHIGPDTYGRYIADVLQVGSQGWQRQTGPACCG